VFPAKKRKDSGRSGKRRENGACPGHHFWKEVRGGRQILPLVKVDSTQKKGKFSRILSGGEKGSASDRKKKPIVIDRGRKKEGNRGEGGRSRP